MSLKVHQQPTAQQPTRPLFLWPFGNLAIWPFLLSYPHLYAHVQIPAHQTPRQHRAKTHPAFRCSIRSPGLSLSPLREGSAASGSSLSINKRYLIVVVETAVALGVIVDKPPKTALPLGQSPRHPQTIMVGATCLTTARHVACCHPTARQLPRGIAPPLSDARSHPITTPRQIHTLNRPSDSPSNPTPIIAIPPPKIPSPSALCTSVCPPFSLC